MVCPQACTLVLPSQICQPQNPRTDEYANWFFMIRPDLLCFLPGAWRRASSSSTISGKSHIATYKGLQVHVTSGQIQAANIRNTCRTHLFKAKCHAGEFGLWCYSIANMTPKSYFRFMFRIPAVKPCDPLNCQQSSFLVWKTDMDRFQTYCYTLIFKLLKATTARN